MIERRILAGVAEAAFQLTCQDLCAWRFAVYARSFAEHR